MRRRIFPCADSVLGLSIVVALISIIIAFAVPIGQRLLIQSRARAVENDLRVFSAAFQAYAAERGDWPAGDGTPGAIPPGMLRYLRETRWQQHTPIGGNYAWDPNSLHQGSRIRAAIVIAGTRNNAVSTDRRQLLEIDRRFDDSDLTSGNYLLGYRNWPVSILER